MLKPRELATVLAALRHWQRTVVVPAEKAADALNQICVSWPDYFTQHEPLNAARIDELCERLNLNSLPMIHLVVADRPDDTLEGRFYEAYAEQEHADRVLQALKTEQPDWDSGRIDLELIG